MFSLDKKNSDNRSNKWMIKKSANTTFDSD